MASSSSHSSSPSSSSSSEIPSSLLLAFHGCTVAVAGKLPGITHDEIRRLVVALGGFFEEKDVSRCSHLITSSGELRTLKVTMARENNNCQLVSYDWLCEAVSEDPSGIKDLLGRISTLNISNGQRSNKRKLDRGSESDGALKKQKSNHKGPIIPIERQQDGSEIELTVNNLPEAVINLMRFLLHKSQMSSLHMRIQRLSQAQKGKQMIDTHSHQRKETRYLDILQFFYDSMQHTHTSSLYLGLLKLQLVEITVLNKQSDEFKALAEYHSETSCAFSNTSEITSIFRIERHGEAERSSRWSKENQASIGDRRLLWHGSQQLNFIGILSHGLCDDAPPTGRIHAGVYLAEMASLSIQFCNIFRGDALMLLCEVECGKHRKHLSHPVTSQHKRWRDASYVHPDLTGINLPDFRGSARHQPLSYTEYVVPNPAQIRQRYLFHLTLGRPRTLVNSSGQGLSGYRYGGSVLYRDR